MNLKCKNNGITLISLVVTIVILLILAGVSIVALTGDNGLLIKAYQSKIKTEGAQEKESVGLAVTTAQIGNDGYQDLNEENLTKALNEQFPNTNISVISNGDGSYTITVNKNVYDISSDGTVENGIDWELVKQTAKAPDEQINTPKTTIGIGTNGEAVNMDLWEYTYLSDSDSYALNDFDVINDSSIENKGYLGTIDSTGKIEGSVPMYIKTKNDEVFKPVTDMNNTFRECVELVIPPAIPKTVTAMFTTFNSCTNLQYPPILPSSLCNMYGTFYNCKSLQYAPNIPDTVTNMAQCFVFCANIQYAPKIPDGVTTLRGTFGWCSSLKNVSTIPASVVDMKNTFIGCYNLVGDLIINASPSIYENCFSESATKSNGLVLSGDCTLLQEILNTKSLSSKISIKND